MSETQESAEFYKSLSVLFPRLRVELLKIGGELSSECAESGSMSDAGAISTAIYRTIQKMEKNVINVDGVSSVRRTAPKLKTIRETQ